VRALVRLCRRLLPVCKRITCPALTSVNFGQGAGGIAWIGRKKSPASVAEARLSSSHVGRDLWLDQQNVPVAAPPPW
jgi:hypothetical protein